MFVWADVETTGLDPREDMIAEVGIIVTTPELVEVHRYSSPAYVPDEVFARSHPVARDMHTRSGLRAECADAPRLSEVLSDVSSLIKLVCRDWKAPHYLAGNTVHFDKAFILANHSRTLDGLSHRVLDVSVFKVLADTWGLDLDTGPSAADAPHRAIPDLENSIALLRRARRALFTQGPAL